MNSAVGIDAPIAQKGPTLPSLVDFAEVAPGQQDLLAIAARLRDDFAERPGHERVAPELYLSFATDSIGRCHENTVGDRMGALNQLPCGALIVSNRARLFGDPADRGGIKRICAPLSAASRAPSGNH